MRKVEQREKDHIDSLTSVLMPVYNEEKYVEEAIISVALQDCKNIEIVIVNDGSTDRTEEKVFEAVHKIKDEVKVTYFAFEQNKGKVAALNKAFSLSSGDYLALLAGDDVMTCNSIKSRKEFLENNKFDVVCSDMMLCTENLDPIHIQRIYRKEGPISWNEEKYKLLFNNFISGGSIFFKRQVAEDLFPIPEDLLFEDWWLSFFLLAKCKIIGHIAEPLLLYRVHGQNDNAGTSLKDYNKRVKKDFERHFAYYASFKKKLTSFQNCLDENEIASLVSFIDDCYEIKKRVLENKLLPLSLGLIKKIGLRHYILLDLLAKDVEYIPTLLYLKVKHLLWSLLGKLDRSI